MDVLNDILDTLDLRGVLYFRTDFSRPWGVSVPDLEQAARFHLVVQGACHVAFPSGAAVTLMPGDLVLIPKGRSHVLADGPGRKAPPLERILEASGYDGTGVFVLRGDDATASTQMICGHLSFRSGADHPLLRALPEYLVITAAMRGREPWLDEVLRLITRRVFSDDIGSSASVTRLSEIMFIEIVRAGVDQSPELQAVLNGFRDRHVGRALELIHARPAEPWTVDSLAAEVGMSRSRFAQRFSAMMGASPMAYLSNWRLQRALSLVQNSRSSIQQVAAQTGYRSAAAFSRAFSGKFGSPPREFRQNLA